MTICKVNIFKPNTNWHRLLHLLDRNGGMLYIAQLYKPRKHQASHDDVITDGMPKMTEASLLSYESRYEQRADWMGWVDVQKRNNRVWVTLLPRGRDVLKAFEAGQKWDRLEDQAVTELNDVTINFKI